MRTIRHLATIGSGCWLAMAACSPANSDDTGEHTSEGMAAESDEGSAAGSNPSTGASAVSDEGSAGSEHGTGGHETSEPTTESSTTGDPGNDASTGASEDVTRWELRIDNYAIPTVQTTYVCFEFTTTLDELNHIVGFESVLDQSDYVHHYVVSKVDAPTGMSPRPCGGFDRMMWAWAPGQPPYLFPQEAGMLVGDGQDGTLTLQIQVHYNNPLNTAGVMDSSGLDVLMTPTLRAYDAGSSVFADIDNIVIPASLPAYEHTMTCTGAQTTAMFSEPIKVFASFLHAHELGRVLTAEIHRDGTLLQELNREDPYSFHNQKFRPIDYVEIQPGDEVQVHCTYDSTSRSEPTYGGPATSDEMCWHQILYYPITSKSSEYCSTL